MKISVIIQIQATLISSLLKDLSVLKCRWGRNPMIKWNIDFVMGKNLKLWPIPVILVLGRLRQDELRVGSWSPTGLALQELKS